MSPSGLLAGSEALLHPFVPLPQSPLQLVCLKGVQLALEELGVGSISICQEPQEWCGICIVICIQ